MKKKIITVFTILVLISLLITGGKIYTDLKSDAAADAVIDEAMNELKLYDNVLCDCGEAHNSGRFDFESGKKVNPDVIAWLTIPNTVIDYPVVQTANNDYYLERDIKKQRNKNGTLFLDYRVRGDFSDFNNVIYGHHMKSGRMFQNLVKFKEEAFFNNNKTGLLWTQKKTHHLEIFAVAIVHQDSELYRYAFASPAECDVHLQKIKNSAKFYRDIDVTEKDHLIIFSTCSYEFKDARTLVIARIG